MLKEMNFITLVTYRGVLETLLSKEKAKGNDVSEIEEEIKCVAAEIERRTGEH